MTKNETTVKDPGGTPSRVNRNTPRKVRGYDEIAPFLHEVNKTVAEECANQTKVEALPWYSKWEQWNDKHLMRSPSINEIGKIICPDLKYNERTVEKIVERITTDITPVSNYIHIRHVSDTSVQWDSLIEVDSFRSLKIKEIRKVKIVKKLLPIPTVNTPNLKVRPLYLLKIR